MRAKILYLCGCPVVRKGLTIIYCCPEHGNKVDARTMRGRKPIKRSKFKQVGDRQRMIKELDAIWSQCIKLIFGGKSEWSKRTKTLEAHHLLGKTGRAAPLRYNLDNGSCLTHQEHIYGLHQKQNVSIEPFLWRKRRPGLEAELRMKMTGRAPDLGLEKIYLEQELKRLKDAKANYTT